MFVPWTNCNVKKLPELRFNIKELQNVESITLNELIKLNCKNDGKILVKLHVEGAEWPIIKSILKTVKNFKNISFIMNLSHDEDSLIKIPKSLGELYMFDMHLYSHSLFGEGLTLFAANKNLIKLI